ncbi:ABC transporter permease [Auraticoccus sp. F435]|uniref:Transport permease protein n=1 Tax=Auraticoccus cholistanensis TaxID=2656650 RepID=A0A6A9V172_9ACTN|nr:ABC transporter permease [Auraticoccus cholistanensis]MVA76590.1 ABC transporter permease [Auraticoccus cholistanensis]
MSTAVPVVGAPPARQHVSALTAHLVLVGRSLRRSLRDVEALLMAVVLPVALMLVFTYVFGGALDPGGGYVDYVVPGIVLTCAGFGASSTAVAVSVDMTSGVIDRFRTMPIPGAAVLTGHAVASLARNLVATVVVVAVAVAVGFRPTAGPGGWLAAAGLTALYILAITWLFTVIGLLADGPEAANGYGFALLFLPYLSSAYVPVDTMPGWLRPLAEHQPLTPVVDTLRALLLGDGTGEPLLATLWCLLVLVLSYAAAAWLFPRRRRR